MLLTFFDNLNDISLFEGELVCICGIIVVDGLAQRHVGLWGRRRLLTGFRRWPGTAKWKQGTKIIGHMS